MKSLLLSVSMILCAVLSAFGQAKDGEASVYTGFTTTVEIGYAYQSTLSRASGVSYSWTSSNTNYFTVVSSTKNQATIKGISPTSSPIRLNYHCSYYYDGYYRTMDFYYDITVIATNVSVANIDLDKNFLNLKTGETYQLTASVYPTNATNRNVNWHTEKYSVASVSSNGLVSANGPGTTTITCIAADGSGVREKCTVIVTDPVIEANEITIDDIELPIFEGETRQLTAKVYPTNTTNKTVTWSSSDPDVATIDSKGLLTAVSCGVVTITAKCGKVSAKKIIIVEGITSRINFIEIDTSDGIKFSSPCNVEVYDMMGVLRYSGQTEYINHLPNGLYIIKVNDHVFKVKL